MKKPVKHADKRGHAPGTRDLVSIRTPSKITDVAKARRHNRLSRLYGYKA